MSQFTTNIVGRVRNLNLPKNKALWPLFEVISNAIHAIEENKKGRGQINIRIIRQGHQEALTTLDKVEEYLVKSFIVDDNGIGFNVNNYRSFLTAESEYKVEKGAKGIGRFVCLKAFKQIEYESTFVDESEVFCKRQFVLKATGNGVSNEFLTRVDAKLTGTSVILNTYEEEYQSYCPKRLRDIGEQIVEHFFIYFLEEQCPVIKLIDANGQELYLQTIYGTDLEPNLSKRIFSVKNEEFKLSLLKVHNASNAHKVHYCGNCRDVNSEHLNKYVSDLVGTLPLNGSEPVTCKAYVTADYLDKHVGNERTKFTFPDTEDEAMSGRIVTFEDIKKEVAKEIEDILKVPLENLRSEKIRAIRAYVDNFVPQFKPVLKYKQEEVKKLPASLDGEKLDIELFKLQQKLELENKQLGSKILSGNLFDNTDEYQSAYRDYIEKSNDIGKSDLVKYVVHRRAVINLLDKFLGQDDNGKFQTERTVHDIFFPIRKESDEVSYEQQNLWFIDERLSYHYYLSSDKPISEMSPISDVNSDDRPDLFIFNSSLAFVDNDAPFNSFIIVEFKRPERNDYLDDTSKRNPVDQVIEYIGKLRNGLAKDRKNKFIQIGDKDRIPFYAYVICDFTPKLNKLLASRDYIVTPDGMGYFYFHRAYNAYVEVISYQKLLKDAKNRNRVLFDKLGIPS